MKDKTNEALLEDLRRQTTYFNTQLEVITRNYVASSLRVSTISSERDTDGCLTIMVKKLGDVVEELEKTIRLMESSLGDIEKLHNETR